MSLTILLTGATDGLGARAAGMMAEQGHHLILHGRSQDRLDAMAKAFSAKTKISQICCDLASLQDVQEMAEKIAASHGPLDVIINNAGVLKAAETQTKEGLELRFVVNSIAPYLLTKRLLSQLAPQGRVVNLSSAAQRPLSADELARFQAYDDMDAYAKSKFAITSWTTRLAQQHSDIMFVSVNPGSLLGTKMVKQGFGIAGADIDIGADIITRAALSDEFTNASGLYYDNDERAFGAPHPLVSDSTLADALIAEMDMILDTHLS